MEPYKVIYLNDRHLYQFPRPVHDNCENQIVYDYKLSDTVTIYILAIKEIYLVPSKIEYTSKGGIVNKYTLRKYKNPKYIIKATIRNGIDYKTKLIFQIQTSVNVFHKLEEAKVMVDDIIKVYNEGKFEFNLIK